MNWFKRKPKPEPWDGKHELKYIKYVEYAAWPDDYFTGYMWKCACGAHSYHLPIDLLYKEADAMSQFKEHRAVYDA